MLCSFKNVKPFEKMGIDYRWVKCGIASRCEKKSLKATWKNLKPAFFLMAIRGQYL